MATAAQVQTIAAKSEKFPEIHCWLHVAAPAIEARALFTLIGRNGNTVEKIRALIAVPPEIEAVLRAYAVRYPEDGASVEQALEFRRRVGEEFERLVRDILGSVWSRMPAQI
ncbi:MAG: hypothetical protein WBC04_12360 [Candidatus Acidiferrales bacterium]